MRIAERCVARMSEAISGAVLQRVPDIAEPVIGRAFARPVGSSGLRIFDPAYLSGIVSGISPVSTTKTASNLAGSVVLALALTW